MFKISAFSKAFAFSCLFIVFGASRADAACSRANLNKCLDSACAINLTANPAARCQLCGTATAGAAAPEDGLKQLSIGANAKITFSDKELKKAPVNPGDRYAWATAGCIKKVEGCTPEDVSDNYDDLIEQSCRAAGVDAQLEGFLKKAATKKTKSACESEINLCIARGERCGGDWKACEFDEDLARVISQCAAEATGCDEFTPAIRISATSRRDAAIQAKDKVIANIVQDYQYAREEKIANAKKTCQTGSGKQACIQNMCAANMRNKCQASEKDENGILSELSMVKLLCQYYDTACTKIK
ncbi:MAG: hypothetical protein LBJ18_00480 [Rickettsiales bacterium]|nr:hypothetical protein [Rickettsiales bacterium]